MARAKIVATIGPASEATQTLVALIEAGMSVARLNASHTPREALERRLAAVRDAAATTGAHVAVMLDLGGPKLRIGEVGPGTVLAEGERFELVTGTCIGDGNRACVTYAGLPGDVPDGARLLLDDGRIELVVTQRRPDSLVTRVVVGGPLVSHKGLNVPGVHLSLDAITPADADDVAWALEHDVDLIAQSFVRSAGDIERLRMLMGDRPIPIVAKIEKHEALASIDDIVRVADAVMVARGDLGVEIAPEEVPVAQQRIVAACRAEGRPVIIATQMLESMIEARRPTRAEASDVANAIFDAVDAVMLSAETAIGAHPAHVIETMARIAQSAEDAAVGHPWAPRPAAPDDVAAAVSRAVCELAGDLDVAAIVTVTQSGATARAIAAHRPRVPVLAATPDAAVARRLALVWGVHPVEIGSYDTIDQMIDAAARAARECGLATSGDRIAVTGGTAVHVAGSTDFIQVHRV